MFREANNCSLADSDALYFTGNKLVKSQKLVASMSMGLDEYAEFIKRKVSAEPESSNVSEKMREINRLKSELHKNIPAWELLAGTTASCN